MIELRREEVARLVARGHLLVLDGPKIYRLNKWSQSHPGGVLAILHFVGRDACDELAAYHEPHIQKTFNTFQVAVASPLDYTETTGWQPLNPPLEAHAGWDNLPLDVWTRVESWKQGLQAIGRAKTEEGSSSASSTTSCCLPALDPRQLEPPSNASVNLKQQRDMSKEYQKMHQQVIDKGLYHPTPLANYRYEMIRYALFFLGAMYFYFKGTNTWHSFLSAVLLGLWKHQITFVVHDAGHLGVFGNFFKDKLLACSIASFCGGLSALWWCDNHNTHHVVTNHTEHDPDIQHMPFFAISTKFCDNLWSTYYRRSLAFDKAAQVFLTVQHKLYYILLAFGRPNLFANSYGYLLTKSKPGFFRNLEFVGIACFWVWFSALLRGLPSTKVRVMYVLACFITTSPLHVQIVLSHFGQSTEDLGPVESFPHRQLRTTMDVDCPSYLDWMHGGLHMQVAHHLFPRVPRHNLRQVNTLVRAYASKFEHLGTAQYETHSFVKGNKKVLGVLAGVAEQVSALSHVAEANVAAKAQQLRADLKH